jgi:hypothetical protein
MDAEYLGDTKWLGPFIPKKNARYVMEREQRCLIVQHVMEKEPLKERMGGQ